MKRWTPEELATLAALAAKPGPLKKKAKTALPGRPYNSVTEKARLLGFGKERVSVTVLDLLADGVPRTVREISDKIDRDQKSVGATLLRLSLDGVYQLTHIVDLKGAGGARRYAIGRGRNACLVTKPRVLRSIRAPEAREDRKFRSNAAWWPRADPDVTEAMRAMMFAGRSAA